MWLIGCKLASNPVKLCCGPRLLLPGLERAQGPQRTNGQLIAYWICVLIAVDNEFKKAEVTASHWPSRAGNALLFNLDIIRSTCVVPIKSWERRGRPDLSPTLSHSPSAAKSQFVPVRGFFTPTTKVGLAEVMQRDVDDHRKRYRTVNCKL